MTYWETLQKNRLDNMVQGCACEFCQGIDICTVQMCWNKFYGAKNGASSHEFSVAQVNAVTCPVQIGFKCVGCQTFNEHAVANRADGTYMCYECRT